MLIKCVIKITQSFKTAYDFFLIVLFILLDFNQELNY